jgi:preprotein translocase subunit SecF
MSTLGRIGARLYQGDVSIDFIGRRKTWYAISAGILVIAIASLVFRGLNFGIEFKGGVEFIAKVSNPAAHVKPITKAVVDTGIAPASNPLVVTSGTSAVRVDTEPLTLDQTSVVKRAIQSAGATEVNPSSIGPTWGASVAKKALTGLIVFVLLVVLFIWAYFREWRMSVAGIVALAHDLVITIGVYALTGFEVTPATVTGLLTILGYSLYDTVVVFDKVRENTRGIAQSTRRTYAESANLAVNQTLVRSINTSVAALLPVGAILYVGTFMLGSGPLKDLALALFVGMAAGAYSSIFIATPLLAQLKMREPAMQAQAKRVANRMAQQQKEAAAAGVAPSAAGGTASKGPATRPAPAAKRTAAKGTSAPKAAAKRAGAEQPASAATEPAEPAEPAEAAVPGMAAARTRDTARPMSRAAAKRAQPKRQARAKRGKGR